MRDKQFYKVIVEETKRCVFAVSAICAENATALVEEACANGSFNLSDIEGDVQIYTDGVCVAPSEMTGKLSLDCNFNVDIYK